MTRVYSIEEAVATFQVRMAAETNKGVHEFAWLVTPMTSTKSVLFTQTPYLRSQEQLNRVCENTNVTASLVSKHNVIVSFDPSDSSTSAITSSALTSTSTNENNWFDQYCSEIITNSMTNCRYQVELSKTEEFKAENERLQAENERLQAENETLKDQSVEDELYYRDQMRLADQRAERAREDTKDLEQELATLKSQSVRGDDIIQSKRVYLRKVMNITLKSLAKNMDVEVLRQYRQMLNDLHSSA
jgi:predicted RNase H-like nuclease (RuvC/YqgF family)